MEQRKKLGGSIPVRVNQPEALKVPDVSIFKELLDGTGEREASTTMSFVRLLAILTRINLLVNMLCLLFQMKPALLVWIHYLDSLVYTHIQDSYMIPLIQISFYITKKKRTDKFLRRA